MITNKLSYYALASGIDVSGLPNHGSGDAAHAGMTVALNIVFGITASMAVLVIVVAGFRYIVARGDPNATAQAKNTIIYAVIGLFVVLAAYSIVEFVLKGLS